MAEKELDLSEITEQIRRMLLAYRRLIVGVACGVALAVVVVVQFLPDRYVSEATLQIVQQRVSQRYVDPTGAAQASATDVLQAMSREVLSRKGLVEIVEEFGLYPKYKGSPPEVIASIMRTNVQVEPIDQLPGHSDFTAFRISFAAATPQLAQAVTTRLTGLFIDENLKARGGAAVATSNFLTEQLKIAEAKVKAQEGRLRQFKLQNLGQLPEQQAANLGNLTDLRTQLMNTTANISRAQQQRLLLDQQRVALEAAIGVTIQRLQSERALLLGRFTARHPEVMRKDEEIAKVQALLERVKSRTPRTDFAPGMASPEDLSASQLETQVAANTAEIENLSKDELRLRAEIDQSQGRMTMLPVREQQLAAIQSDYEVDKREYNDLKNKQLQSQLTTSVQERREGEQFRLVDAPTLPILPTSPKRIPICAGGVLAGLLIGLGLAFLMDHRDTSFHSEQALKAKFPFPLVVGVPLIVIEEEETALRVKKKYELMAMSAMVLVVLAAEFYVYRHH